MDWKKSIVPVIEAGAKMYLNGQLVKKTTMHAKEVILREGILLFGLITFMIFVIASVLMIFVDLGRQLENGELLHFSGMMTSAVYLSLSGLIFFVCSFFLEKMLERVEMKRRKKIAASTMKPGDAMSLFVDEFVKDLVRDLDQSAKQKSNY